MEACFGFLLALPSPVLLLGPGALLALVLLASSPSPLLLLAVLTGFILCTALLQHLRARMSPLPLPSLSPYLLDLLLQHLPSPCEEQEQEVVQELVEHLVTTWLAPWYPCHPPPPLLVNVRSGIERLVDALDKLEVVDLTVGVGDTLQRRLRVARVAALVDREPELEHPVSRGRWVAQLQGTSLPPQVPHPPPLQPGGSLAQRPPAPAGGSGGWSGHKTGHNISRNRGV